MSANWSEIETRELLSIRAEAEIVRQINGTVRDALVYERIKEKMHERGFMRKKSQVISKLKTLRKKFHQVHDSNNKSGSGRLDWPFYDLCYTIWGTSHSANPVALLGSMESSFNSGEEEVTPELACSGDIASSSSSSSSPSASTCASSPVLSPNIENRSECPQPPPAKKAKKSLSRTQLIVKEVKDLFLEMDRDFEERQSLRLAEQREYEERLRREAQQAREAELATQMSMMRELQESQNRFLSELLRRMPSSSPSPTPSPSPSPTPYYVPPRRSTLMYPSTSTLEDMDNTVFRPGSSRSYVQLD
nr:NADPH oxidase activator-like [Misgurnus anguillicaudatus]